MLTFTNEFFVGVFIGACAKWHGRPNNMGALIQRIHNKTVSGEQNILARNRKVVERSNDYDRRTESDPKFSFNKMVFEIHKFLGEEKAVAVSTIRNFYLRRTTLR